MHCKKVSYFFKELVKFKLLPLPKTGEVLHGTYPKPSLG